MNFLAGSVKNECPSYAFAGPVLFLPSRQKGASQTPVENLKKVMEKLPRTADCISVASGVLLPGTFQPGAPGREKDGHAMVGPSLLENSTI